LNQPGVNLPNHLAPLIGRAQEVAELGRLLADPRCRLLTLAGPGGIGKTQLALAVAAHADGFAHGVHFVPLQPVQSIEFLVPAIANATGIPLAGQDPLPTQLLNNLRGKEMLLLLDNFEHLLAAADLLVDILRAAPGVKLLLTSRQVAGVREEWRYPVSGLAVPPATKSEDDPAHYGAVQLFVERARQVRPDFRWEEQQADEREAVVSICRQVEGNPLALELAAAWLAVLDSKAIAAQLRQSLDLLATTLRNAPERHRSMRAVFDHSWQLLSPQERAVFAKLTLFQGGFTRHAAQVVVGASLDNLSALIAKSLLRREPDGRYQIHELLRQFGAEQLAAFPAEVAAARAAHSAYFMAFLVERRVAFQGAGQLQAAQEIAAELENVHTAWRWCVEHSQDEAQAKAVRQAMRPLHDFHQQRSRYLEGAAVLAAAIHHLEAQAPAGAPGAALAECLTRYGSLCIRLGRIAEAGESLARAHQLHEQLRIPPPYHWALNGITVQVILALVQGDYGQATALGEQFRREAEQHNQPQRLAFAHYMLASAALAQGLYETARDHAEQGLALCESLGERWLRTSVHDVLGQVASMQGEPETAKRHFESAYAICAQFDAPGGMATHLKNLGDVAIHRQEWGEARLLYRRSLELYQATGDRGGAAGAHGGLGVAAYHLDMPHSARRHFGQALEMALSTHSVRMILAALAEAGEFLLQTAGAGRGKALSLRALRFVRAHPSSERKTQERAAASLQQGAAAWKEQPTPDETLESLAAALQAELAIPAEDASPWLEAEAYTPAPVEPLSARELEVLRLLAAGHGNEEIARKLVVAIGTVKAHTGSIYRKLDVDNRTRAVARGRELGLID
jgi:predicted ATPase/DNA-binding CsgD family transcriptional regulator